MKTNPRVVKSFLTSSIVSFILFGTSFCGVSNANAESEDFSISRSVYSEAEVREAIQSARDEYNAEYNKIYKQVVQDEMNRIADPNSTQSKFVKFALQFEGTPYWYGGSTPSGFDCSGFVGYVIKHELGIDVRHSASSQMQLGVKVSDPLPGDLIGWGWGNYFHHVGIYIGDGKEIDALNPYRDLYVRDVKTMTAWMGKPTYVRIIEKNRNFNADRITKRIMDNGFAFTFAQ
jgi:cell wall-associated NlpC family hydrolase